MKPGFIILIIIVSILALLAISFGIFYLMITNKLYTYPANNPYQFMRKYGHLKKKKKRIVFIGDSLTHANISSSYIKLIKEKLGTENYEYINAGMNAELTYNVLKRLDSIIACEPDFVTILIGTNDSNREYDKDLSRHAEIRLKLPQMPNKKWFVENYNAILTELTTKTNAKIAICSIPPVGENIQHKACQKSIDYSKTIKELATKYKVKYLPVNEKMLDYLKKNPTKPKYNYDERIIEKAAYQHFLFRKDFDTISKNYDFALVTDHIHLNSNGAKIIANLMIEFIQ